MNKCTFTFIIFWLAFGTNARLLEFSGHKLQRKLYLTYDEQKLLDSVEKYCMFQRTYSFQEFYELPDFELVDFNVMNNFEDGKTIGKGGFGEVREVLYTPKKELNVKIALKKMIPRSDIERKLAWAEIKALTSVRDSEYFPRLYGCAYNPRSHYYIAQELLDHSLEKSSFTDYIKVASIGDSLRLYLQIFTALKEFWDWGFVHNDIKPNNLMTNKENSKIYLIDLGLAQKKTDLVNLRGTECFMSPAKYEERKKVFEQKDDLYSVAVTIAFFEAPHGLDSLFVGFEKGKFSTCFKTHNKFECREKLMENVEKILSKVGYGERQANPTKSTVNFTTLILLMIEYDYFKWKYEDIIEIINRLIEEDAQSIKKKEIERAEEERIKRELAEAEELKKQLEEIQKQEKEAQAELEIQESGLDVLLKVNNILKDKQEKDALKAEELREPKDPKIIQKQKAILETQVKLDAIRKSKYEKELKIDEYENRQKRASQVYNKNKEMFLSKGQFEEEEPEEIVFNPNDVKVPPKKKLYTWVEHEEDVRPQPYQKKKVEEDDVITWEDEEPEEIVWPQNMKKVENVIKNNYEKSIEAKVNNLDQLRKKRITKFVFNKKVNLPNDYQNMESQDIAVEDWDLPTKGVRKALI